jgi:diguanylate cyclase (GGDEF)-like protein
MTAIRSDRFATPVATADCLQKPSDPLAHTQICSSPCLADECDAAIAPASAYLIMVAGGIPGTMFRLTEQFASFGRAAHCTHQLHDITVSRVHAFVSIDSMGQFYIRDEGSTNGTFVNGMRLTPRHPKAIQDGDRVQLGTAVILKLVRLGPRDAEFQREMFERTVRDTLTGLYQRAYFLDRIGALANRTAAAGLGLAVLMLDVDHFKQINDLFGHVTGDLVLMEVAAVLRESTRSEDLVARYGGEEFILALPVASADTATARAERIRTSLAGRQIAAGDEHIHVTASLGLVYSSPTRPKTEQALIIAADRALYRAKNEGRNRVILGQSAAHVPLARTESAEFPSMPCAG